MAYSLTYTMPTGQGLHISETADDAIYDHASLVRGGASEIVIRDAKLIIVTLAAVAVLASGRQWPPGSDLAVAGEGSS